MCGQEYGRCEVCGAEGPLDRTYFYYDIRCDCCGNRDGYHFELMCHCSKCPAPMPDRVRPLIKAMDGRSYKAVVTNVMPIQISGEFIIDRPIIIDPRDPELSELSESAQTSETYTTFSELYQDLRYELNQFNSWSLPVLVDDKKIRRGSVCVTTDSTGAYRLEMQTVPALVLKTK